jgi:hypothetical protein
MTIALSVALMSTLCHGDGGARLVEVDKLAVQRRLMKVARRGFESPCFGASVL